MLICERVIVEQGSNKKTLVGIFARITYKKLPLIWPELWLYINLSDVVRRHSIKTELVCLEDNRQLLEVKGTLEPKKLLNWELVWQLRGIHFGKGGDYVFRFWVGDDIIGEKYLHLRSAK
jgi:hypothetical protein